MNPLVLKRMALGFAGPLVLASALFGCSDKVVASQPAPPPPQRGPVISDIDAAAPVAKGVEYTENDFVESERSRDPFRSYVSAAQAGPKVATNQRQVKLAEYTIDELKLVGIVLSADGARAMFVDPSSKGSVVYKGDYVCRPELVRMGGSNGPEYQLNWRIDRIREGDVVLIREDPAQPAIPPATRIVPLHPEAANKRAEL